MERGKVLVACLVVGLLVLVACVPAPTASLTLAPTATAPLDPTATPGPPLVRWVLPIGTGPGPGADQVLMDLVDGLNESQDEVHVILEIVPILVGYDELRAELAVGNLPDLFGPVGRRGANAFRDEWLDIEP